MMLLIPTAMDTAATLSTLVHLRQSAVKSSMTPPLFDPRAPGKQAF